MKAVLRAIASVAAVIGACATAFAQVPAGVPQAPDMHHASPARMACRAQIDAQSLTGEQRKAAMHACMAPHVDACRQQAAQKGLAKGPERKEFMHACMQGA